MSKVDESISRLESAIAALEGALAAREGSGDAADGVLAEVQAERSLLAEEVEHLRARAAKDAELRSEAADAVRQALLDLRGAVGNERHGHA